MQTLNNASLIVLGAGASCFCGKINKRTRLLNPDVSLVNEHPPITSDICDNLISRSNSFKALTDLLNEKRAANGASFDFEKSLRDIWNQYNGSSVWNNIFVDFRNALHSLFQMFSNDTAELYENLVVAAQQSNSIAMGNREVIFITLNYEKLLQNSVVPKNKRLQLNGRINDSPFSIFQPHGSVDWYWKKKDWRGEKQPILLLPAGQTADKLVKATEEGMWISQNPRSNSLPALAIPMSGDVQGKTCWPESQEKMLHTLLPKVDRIAIIGWRGADKHILELLSNNLTKIDQLTIADPDSAVYSKLSSGFSSNLKSSARTFHIAHGFSGMFLGAKTKRPIDLLFN